MGDGALSLCEAHAIYQQLRQTEGVDFTCDTEAADALLVTWTSEGPAALPARL